jgi:hypothetical protein
LHAVLHKRPGGLTDPQKVLDFSKKVGPKYFTYAQRAEKWYGFPALWEVFCKSLILKSKKAVGRGRLCEFPTPGYRFPEIEYPLFTKLSTNKWMDSPDRKALHIRAGSDQVRTRWRSAY